MAGLTSGQLTSLTLYKRLAWKLSFETALGGRQIHDSYLIFKNHLLMNGPSQHTEK